MIYDIKAIPTTYAGVNFRSRLEARWAAFFDLCGWRWDYEPFDLEGWAPDFMLKGKIKALVEVKPIDFSSTEVGAMRQARAMAAKAFRTADKFYEKGKPTSEMSHEELLAYIEAQRDRLAPEYEILVVGNGPFKGGAWASDWTLGVMALEIGCCDDIADLFFSKSSPNCIDYAARYGRYTYRINGRYDGDHHLHQIDDDTPDRLWREAGNMVQWKPQERRQRSGLEIIKSAVEKAERKAA